MPLGLALTLTLCVTLTLSLTLTLALTKVTHDASGQWVSFVKESSMDSVFGALHGAPTGLGLATTPG